MSSDNTLMLSATRLRPGTAQGGVILGTPVQTTSTTPSGFTAVTTTPSGYTRINLMWIPGGPTFNGYQIAFGQNDAVLDTALTAAPLLISSIGLISFLLLPSDQGFKIKASGADTNNLYWWIG